MKNINLILDFAATPHKLPDDVLGHCEHLLADTLAVGAAGAYSPEAQVLLPIIRQWGANDDARILSRDEKLPAASAAFFNGFAIHCLEWDAVHEGAVVHAMSVVSAALLAMSDKMGGSDRQEFLTALAIGVDIASGFGMAATGPMKFFRPATAGLMGASLACARLAGASREEMANIIGLAYSFIGGTMQAHVEASITLPLQIANAAKSAIMAVDLGCGDMNGPHDILDGPFGYGALIEPLDLTEYCTYLGKIWRIAEVSVKPYPSGRASHGALGALAKLYGDGAVNLGNVAGMKLYAPPLIHRLVARPYMDGMRASYARLSLPFLAAMMVRDGYINPAYFDDAGMADDRLAALAKNISVILDDNQDGNALGPQRLLITLKDGSEIAQIIHDNLGSPNAPMSAKQVQEKYDLCRALCPETTLKIFNEPLNYATEKK
ncbi:MmgE/PrpD [Sphingorhabdus lutea]|uniref:MmgE/PrpD n=1 Tax=Sphingorhabdus lutea TaxID=1913578 RepID=A0A1L3J981_9SPHN|nr:MmgE/PrpD family protein [Sphingorhabdus lutea]APG61653.1 MmgE/PrpD [Sphingorhabdus lutea]